MCSTCMPSAQKPEEGVGTSLLVQELNLGPLQGLVLFFSLELLVQPLYMVFNVKHFSLAREINIGCGKYSISRWSS